MSPDTGQKVVAVAVALVAAVTWLIAGHQAALAGHTIAGNHCLRGVPPANTCRLVYSLQGQNLLDRQKSFHLWDFRFASQWANAPYESALDTAEFNWGKAVGPQAPSEPVSSSTGLATTDNYFYNCPNQGDPGDGCSNIYTCLVNVNFVEQCGSAGGGVSIRHARIFINHEWFRLQADIVRVRALAHDMGHSLGLAHHNDPDCLMLQEGIREAPQPCDLGSANPFVSPEVAPCDSAPESWGIRCIYWWWREQDPVGNQDCYDLNRNGVVDLSDISLASLAFDQLAGEPRYHPDADIDRDGWITLGDIGRIANQFDHVCAPPQHYTHS